MDHVKESAKIKFFLLYNLLETDKDIERDAAREK